jgi:uncharacterized phage protein gp47/JayE
MPFNRTDPKTGKIIEYGLSIPSLEDLTRTLNNDVIKNIKIATKSDITIDTSNDSVISRLNKTFGAQIHLVWEEAKKIEDSMYVKTSNGVSLSKLALLVGFLRTPSTSTIGEVRVWGDNKTFIPVGTTYASVRGDEFYTPEEAYININKCLSFEASIGVLKNDRKYRIDIDSKKYIVYSDKEDSTRISILTKLQDELSKDLTITTLLVDTSTAIKEDSGYLQISKVNQKTPMNCEASSLITPSNVQIEQQIKAKKKGLVFGDADTITVVVTPVTGLKTIINLEDFILGDSLENDRSLQERITTDHNSVGSGTYDTILTNLRSQKDVSSIYIDANTTFSTSSTNVPPKAYEVIIHHLGDDEKIAQAIWNTLPAGIATHGRKIVDVLDANNITQQVEYTLAKPYLAYIRVTYTRLIGEGEIFPIDGDLQMQDAVAEEGQQYKINEDLIGKRFYAPIFEQVEGILTLNVEVYLTPSENPIPPSEEYNPDEWSSRLSVGREEIATFGTERVITIDLDPPIT